MQRDPALERILPRLATYEAPSRIACDPGSSHRDRARSDGFLALGLSFSVPGSGEEENPPPGYYTNCVFDEPGGRGTLGHLDPSDILPEARRALEPCGMAPGAAGPISVKLEVEQDEILDVSVAGGADGSRRCVEEALWTVSLPDHFNDGILRPVQYTFALAPGAIPTR
jgi:hypothetical protein